MADVLINKIAESGLLTLDLEKYYSEDEVIAFDLKDYLFMELILKERDYREALKNLDWSIYQNKIVAICCSTDVIIPLWAYMLAVTYLEPYTKDIYYGNDTEVQDMLLLQNIKKIDTKEFAGKRVVVKGCGDRKVPQSAYIEITKILRPVAKSIMFGEPCSTVPIFKAPKNV